ncbi:hypothetical protein [Rhodomicrobium sp.]|uniref:hypothetical protein n=1 Tax=Rhodomicrobium sp. TaxID=2720632 RepID=UPI0039E47769
MPRDYKAELDALAGPDEDRIDATTKPTSELANGPIYGFRGWRNDPSEVYAASRFPAPAPRASTQRETRIASSDDGGDRTALDYLGDFNRLTPEERQKSATEMYQSATDELQQFKDSLGSAEQLMAQQKADHDAWLQQRPHIASAPDRAERTKPKALQMQERYVGELRSEIDRAEQRLRLAEDIRAGRAPAPSMTKTRSYAESFTSTTGDMMVANPVKFAGIIGGYLGMAAGTDIGPDNNAVYRFGETISNFVNQQFPGDPARQYDLGTRIARGAGSLAALYGTGALSRIAAQGPNVLHRLAQGNFAVTNMASGGVPQFEAASQAMRASEAPRARQPSNAARPDDAYESGGAIERLFREQDARQAVRARKQAETRATSEALRNLPAVRRAEIEDLMARDLAEYYRTGADKELAKLLQETE